MSTDCHAGFSFSTGNYNTNSDILNLYVHISPDGWLAESLLGCEVSAAAATPFSLSTQCRFVRKHQKTLTTTLVLFFFGHLCSYSYISERQLMTNPIEMQWQSAPHAHK